MIRKENTTMSRNFSITNKNGTLIIKQQNTMFLLSDKRRMSDAYLTSNTPEKAFWEKHPIARQADTDKKQTETLHEIFNAARNEWFPCKYLINITFYAGSDAPEDTDHDRFVMMCSRKYSKKEMEKLFSEVCEKLNNNPDNYDINDPDRPEFIKINGDEISFYADDYGINSDTLIAGVAAYTSSVITKPDNTPITATIYDINISQNGTINPSVK